MSARSRRRAMERAAARLRAAGIDDPTSDLRRMMAEALEVAPARLSLMDDALTPAQAARFDAFVARRAARQPVAQIVGRRAFWRHDFTVTPDTLDPRPDTETLVAHALTKPWQRVLDLGTGTGAILISLLAERRGATGIGADLSPAALAVARENAARIGVAADFVLSDWFAAIDGRFDLIVSNPPYIALAEMAGLAPEVRDHEPHLALTDGGDGLGAYRAIVAGAAAHLNPGGWLMVEIGPTQADAVSAIFAQAGLRSVETLLDLDDRPRVVLGQRGDIAG